MKSRRKTKNADNKKNVKKNNKKKHLLKTVKFAQFCEKLQLLKLKLKNVT